MAEEVLKFPMESDLPSRVAKRFVAWMADRDIHLRSDLASLERDFELALENECKSPDDLVLVVDDEHYDLGTGAACFFGEVLRQQFSGTWYGELKTRSGLNYYFTRIRFGDYHFSPFRWISYRLRNGRKSEGSVGDCLRAVIPSMKDGVDQKQERIDSIVGSGGSVVDYEIF